MNRKVGCLLAVILSVTTTDIAMAQESPTTTWNSSVTWRNPLERSVDLDVAEAQQRARRGGYGPAQINTTYNGDVTTNNEYNAPVSNSSATTATNLNSFSSTVQQEGSGSATVHFQTGNTAYNTTQNATAINATSGTGPTQVQGNTSN